MRSALIYLFLLTFACAGAYAQGSTLQQAGEKRLTNIKQLTFGGENAEAYFSADGKKLSFQSKRDGRQCDQIYTMNIDGTGTKMISSGDGRTTCAFFHDNNRRVLYGSTHLGSKECPPNPDFSKGYVWAIYPTYDIYSVKTDGTGMKQLTSSPGYDAEATLSLTLATEAGPLGYRLAEQVHRLKVLLVQLISLGHGASSVLRDLPRLMGADAPV